MGGTEPLSDLLMKMSMWIERGRVGGEREREGSETV